MKATGIITDSHSSISQEEAKLLEIRVLPMPFYIDGECFYEGVDLTRDTFFERLESGASISTSQPSPTDVMGLWDQALEEYEQVLYMLRLEDDEDDAGNRYHDKRFVDHAGSYLIAVAGAYEVDGPDDGEQGTLPRPAWPHPEDTPIQPDRH